MTAPVALAGLYGGAVRRQEVLTDYAIVQAARLLFDGTIPLDPCASSNPADHFAELNVTVDPRVHAIEAELKDETLSKKARLALVRERRALYLSGPALEEDWELAAYVNPPFEFLEAWLGKCVRESAPAPVVALFPVRMRRVWWCAAVRAATECYALGPIAFKGEKQDAPFDMAIAVWGSPSHELGACLKLAGVPVTGQIKVL
jgi:hypothetical protein